MSKMLSIYSANAFVEYLLPAVNNADFSITVSKSVFYLDYDIDLKLEVVDNDWIIKESGQYSVCHISTKEDYTGRILRKGDLLSLTAVSGEQVSIVVHETSSVFSVCEKFDIRKVGEIKIGNDTTNEIQYDAMHLVSRLHAVIKRQGDRFLLEDKSSNGTFVNSLRISSPRQLQFGDRINIFGLHIIFLDGIIAINTSSDNVIINCDFLNCVPDFNESSLPQRIINRDKLYFHRSPRQIPPLEFGSIEIDAVPEPKQQGQQSILMSVGPAMTMALPMLLGCSLSILSSKLSGAGSGLFMYTGLVTALGSACVGTFWAVRNAKYNKTKAIADEQHRVQAYSNYLDKMAGIIKSKYEKNRQIIRMMYPDCGKCVSYNEESVELWNRNASHKDVLFERLGIGDMDFQVTIDIPKDKFSLIDDKLSEKPKMLRNKYSVLHDVPVGVDLGKDRIIGIVGGTKKRGAYRVMKNLVVQIAATLCYTDVKMAFLYNGSEDRECNWEFAKWIPHVWSQDKNTRYVASKAEEARDVLYELEKIFRQRLDGEKVNNKPHFILFLSDTSLIKDELINHYIFDVPEKAGLTTVFLVEKYGELPNDCSKIIQNDNIFTGMYSLSSDERISIRFDSVEDYDLENFARRLANTEVEEKEISSEIPSTLTFLEMYGVKSPYEMNSAERWKKNRNYESMKVPIGQKSGRSLCMLDVHEKYHGPHGLIAGTTGSGKSETLQTYILSLAVNYSPDDVAFFIIDFKGGGMANLFKDLPHLIGQISNLSGNQVNRAMISIKSENMRRQRIFNEHGVNNINLYTQMYKNGEAQTPIPHLFIIIDEFAELKREEPEFMKELISVAQVGRSLGVHLILATQKPSGTVDDNIWSNSKFRLCLRVQDRQDSSDMLHKPDAAYITQAGRGYLQVGNDELYDLFQSGYGGALYDENDSYMQDNIAQMISLDGKAALVGDLNKARRMNLAKKKWILTLIEIMESMPFQEDYSSLYAKLDSLEIDYPENEYNTRRLNELYSLYKQISNEMSDADQESIALAVIDYANKNKIRLPEQKEKTQLDAVVDYLGKVAKENRYENSMVLWLPVLPTVLYLHELEGFVSFDNKGWVTQNSREWNLSCLVGLYDDPVNQAQRPVVIDISKGHYAIYGTVVSGKSTFLQTYMYSLINKYSPSDVNIYAIDYSNRVMSAFEKAPHIGGIVFEDEPEKLEKMFNLIEKFIAERKVLLKGGDYKQYVKVHGVELPAIVIIIDNYGAFKASVKDKYEDLILNIAKNGINYGIYLMITASGIGISEVSGRLNDSISNTVCLEMRDKFAYADVLRTMHLSVIPEKAVKGRGLVHIEDTILEFQTALALCADDDYKRLELIQSKCEVMNGLDNYVHARKIPIIPDNPKWADITSDPEYHSIQNISDLLPIAYDWATACLYSIHFDRVYCYSIIGKKGTGKTNLIKVIMASCADKGSDNVLIDYSGRVSVSSHERKTQYLSDDEAVYGYFEKLLPIFVDRNKKKREYTECGMSDHEIFEKMQEECRICIFINDLNDFIEHIYKKSSGVGDVSGFLENIIEKGRLHNVFWFACIDTDRLGEIAGFPVYEKFISYHSGVNLGGALGGQRILNVDHIPYTEQNKVLPAGIGVLPRDEITTQPGKIIVPLLDDWIEEE